MTFKSINRRPGNKISPGVASADALLWLFALICVWTGLGSYGVLNNNEGLYAQIPQDMLHSGAITHWIIPQLDGLPYMEKPPLLYWLTAIAFALFGQAEWVVRLVPTLAALTCVGLLNNFGRRIHRPQFGRLAALMFISGLGVMVIARTLIFDMLLTAFLTGALLHALLFQLEHHLRDLRIASVCLALAVLTKGFVALLLFGMVLPVWILLVHGKTASRHLRKWLDPVSAGIFFAITVPWFLAASWVEPIFPWFFFVNEHVLRFLGVRMPHDFYSGPWWYYLPRMVIYLFPWSLLVPVVLLSARSIRSRTEQQEFILLKKTLMLGWLVPLLFFSLSSAKANYYLIVGTPFLALDLALRAEQCDYLSGARIVIFGVLVALLSGALAMTAQFFPQQLFGPLLDRELLIAGMSWLEFAVLGFWLVAAVALLSAWVAWYFPKVGLVAYTALPICLMVALLLTTHAMNEEVSGQSMAGFIRQLQPVRAVYLYRNFELNSSLAFYLEKPLIVIDSTSADLYWGGRLRPGNSILVTREQFKTHTEPKAVVVADIYLDEFAHKKMHTRFLHNRHFGSATVFY